MSSTELANYDNELAALANAAKENTKQRAPLLKFNKGVWQLGTEKTKVPSGTRYTAVLSEMVHGWANFAEKDYRVGRAVDHSFVPPKREELSSLDKEEWPPSKVTGEPTDPWNQVIYLPLVAEDDGARVLFTTTSNTGRDVCWQLVNQVVKAKRPGQYPVVEIFNDTYESRKFGAILVPGFKIVGWKGRQAIAAPTINNESFSEDVLEKAPSPAKAKTVDGEEDIPF
jgi:hypothetical protein